MTPNPFTEIVTITSDIPIYKIIITNLQGNTDKVLQLNGQSMVELNLDPLVPGIALMQFLDNKNRLLYTKRLLKINE